MEWLFLLIVKGLTIALAITFVRWILGNKSKNMKLIFHIIAIGYFVVLGTYIIAEKNETVVGSVMIFGALILGYFNIKKLISPDVGAG